MLINNPLKKDYRGDTHMNNVAHLFIQNVYAENQEYTNLHKPAAIFF